MTFSCLPTALTSVFFSFAHWLDKQTHGRAIALGACRYILFARGCRTVTSWLRAVAAIIGEDFRQSYVHRLCRPGASRREHGDHDPRRGRSRLVKDKRLRIGIDDTPTFKRYGSLGGGRRYPPPSQSWPGG